MLSILLMVIAILVLAIVLLVLAIKGKSPVSAAKSEIHALYEAGVLTEQHVVDYFEAKIAVEKASAVSMLAHAEAATKSVSKDAAETAAGAETIAAKV